jgi:hypothetical protein
MMGDALETFTSKLRDLLEIGEQDSISVSRVDSASLLSEIERLRQIEAAARSLNAAIEISKCEYCRENVPENHVDKCSTALKQALGVTRLVTMEEVARAIVAAAPRCVECGEIATKLYSDPRRETRLCSRCCKLHCLAAAGSLLGETYEVSEIPEGKHAVEVANAYGLESSDG